VQTGEVTLVLQYTDATESLPAVVLEEPPDPCFAQQTAWNQQTGGGLTQAVVERLVHFARFACAARITVNGGTITSFRPGLPPPT
jgi:hypothetical protein